MWRSRITKKVCAGSDNDFQKIADRVSAVSITGNLILSVFKLTAGIVSHSNAMISDAVHSVSDVFSTIAVIIGIRLASKEADKEHPYGHERMECVAAISIVGKEAMFWYTKIMQQELTPVRCGQMHGTTVQTHFPLWGL